MTQSPFCQGYRDAIEGTCWDPSPREVAQAHPEYSTDDVSTYINGVDDGMRGDSFRFDLISSSEKQAIGRSIGAMAFSPETVLLCPSCGSEDVTSRHLRVECKQDFLFCHDCRRVFPVTDAKIGWAR